MSAGTVTGTTTIEGARAFLISLAINSSNKGVPIFNRYAEVIGIAAESPDGHDAGLVFPSSLLAKLKQLGEPGGGVGSGEGQSLPAGPPPRGDRYVRSFCRRRKTSALEIANSAIHRGGSR